MQQCRVPDTVADQRANQGSDQDADARADQGTDQGADDRTANGRPDHARNRVTGTCADAKADAKADAVAGSGAHAEPAGGLHRGRHIPEAVEKALLRQQALVYGVQQPRRRRGCVRQQLRVQRRLRHEL